MAVTAPTGTPSGTVALSTSFNTTMPVPATGTGNILTAYSVPSNASDNFTYAMTATLTSADIGTNLKSLTANKVYSASGVFTVSTPITINLSTCVCTDGSTGFNQVRELFIFNDSLPANAWDLLYDLTAGATGFGSLFVTGTLTTVKITIPAGTFFHIGNPYEVGGWTVGTSINIVLDPQTHAIPYRILILGSN